MENRPRAPSKAVADPAIGSAVSATLGPARNEALYVHGPTSSGVKRTCQIDPLLALQESVSLDWLLLGRGRPRRR